MEVYSEAPRCELLIPHLPKAPENQTPLQDSFRVFLKSRQTSRHRALAAVDPVKGETVVRESAHYLEVLRLVRKHLSGHGCASLPLSPRVVRGRVGSWLFRSGRSSGAWNTTLIQEWLCLISREPLVLGVLLSSCVWEERVLMSSGSLWPCPWASRANGGAKGPGHQNCPSPSPINEPGWTRKEEEKLPTAKT